MRKRILILGLAIVPMLLPALHAQQVVDRIVAKIEDDILTQSDVRDLGRYQQLLNGAGEGKKLPEEGELIDRLIDQWIVSAEATTVRFPPPTKEEVQEEVDRLAAGFGSAEAYRARLLQLGLTPASLTRQVGKQIYLERYLDYKLRPVAHVETAQVERYYSEELVPELTKRGQDFPALENVDAQIRELLTQREISTRATKWLEETRTRLKIEIMGKRNKP